jgi:anti-sigma B factor antagonist
MALRVDTKESNGVTVLTLAGRITLGDESNQMRNKIKEILGQGKKKLVLDLGGVSYIDSSGLGTLVAAYTSARNRGADIKLANVTERLDELLSITKLVTVFSVYKSLEEAVKSFA